MASTKKDNRITVNCPVCSRELDGRGFKNHMYNGHDFTKAQAAEAWLAATGRQPISWTAMRNQTLSVQSSEVYVPSVQSCGVYVMMDMRNGHFEPVAVTDDKIEADKWKSYNKRDHEILGFELNKFPIEAQD